MTSPAGLRPIWRTLKRTRLPPAPTLLHNSRTFASQKEPTDDLEQSLESIKKLGGKEGFNNANEGSDTIDVPRESLSDIRSANSSSLDMKDLKMSIYEMAAGAERPERFPRAVLEKKVGTGVQYPEVKRERDPKPPQVRIPRSVQAIYLRPLRREAQYGVPCCDLQLRSYSVRGLEFFADFALRAAYYLHLPAYGPVPLPRMIQRWTVPKSHFIYKKSQENFERITLRRLIQIKDGHPESVELWLAFLRKHQHHGVGMKANVWEYEKIGVGKEMDVKLSKVADEMEPAWGNFGRQHNVQTAEKVMELMNSEKFRQATGHSAI